MGPSSARPARALLDLLLAAALLLALPAWLLTTWPSALVLAGVLLATAHLARSRPRLRRPCVGWCAGFVLVLALEGALALAGFRYAQAPLELAGAAAPAGAGARAENPIVPDPDLRWRFRPDAEWAGMHTNRLGYN